MVERSDGSLLKAPPHKDELDNIIVGQITIFAYPQEVAPSG